MILQMYAIFDHAVGVYRPPMFVRHVGEIARSLEVEVNRPDAEEGNMLARHPEDFHVYHLGVFDDNSGQMELLVPPVRTFTADQFRK